MNNVNSFFQILISISSPSVNVLSRTLNIMMNSGIKSKYLCLVPELKYMNVKNFNCFVVFISVQFSHSVLSDSATPWTAAHQAHLSVTNSQSLSKLMSIESVMPSNHLILCYPLLLLPSILPSIRVFSNESTLRIRWPKYWSFSFSISPSNEYSGFRSTLGLTGWISLQSKGLSRVFSKTTVQNHQFFDSQLSL